MVRAIKLIAGTDRSGSDSWLITKAVGDAGGDDGFMRLTGLLSAT
jgi:hypothetical protein